MDHKLIDKVLKNLEATFKRGADNVADVNVEIAKLREEGITFNRTYSEAHKQGWQVRQRSRTIQDVEFTRYSWPCG